MNTKTFLLLFSIATLIAWKSSDTILQQLGVDEKQAQTSIVNNIVGDFTDKPIGSAGEDHGGSNNSLDAQLKAFKLPYARLLPAIISGDKVKAAKDLCNYIKTYVNSADFKKAYEQKRAKMKPTEEPWRPDDATIKSQEQQLKESEAQIAKAGKMLSADQQKQMKQALDQQKKQIAEWKTPAPNNAKWEKEYPADPMMVVKTRLQEYIALAATVDFDAKLSTVGRRQKFVNPDYEAKPLKWKAMFRAGKEVNAVTVAFAKEWLKELK